MTSPNAEQIEALRDRIVDTVARRMMAGLRAGETVAWCGSAKLTAAGVQVGPTVVPWGEVQERANQSNGQYAISKPGGRGTLVQLSMIGATSSPAGELSARCERRRKVDETDAAHHPP